MGGGEEVYGGVGGAVGVAGRGEAGETAMGESRAVERVMSCAASGLLTPAAKTGGGRDSSLRTEGFAESVVRLSMDSWKDCMASG